MVSGAPVERSRMALGPARHGPTGPIRDRRGLSAHGAAQPLDSPRPL